MTFCVKLISIRFDLTKLYIFFTFKVKKYKEQIFTLLRPDIFYRSYFPHRLLHTLDISNYKFPVQGNIGILRFFLKWIRI